MMHITRKYIQDHPHVLFVFGDNDKRYGLGGMAKEFRGEPNTIGIRVKKAPSMGKGSFYTDDEFELNCSKIIFDLIRVEKIVDYYQGVYIPSGIGEGLAKLKEKAPRTYAFLKESLRDLKENLDGIQRLHRPDVS